MKITDFVKTHIKELKIIVSMFALIFAVAAVNALPGVWLDIAAVLVILVVSGYVLFVLDDLADAVVNANGARERSRSLAAASRPRFIDRLYSWLFRKSYAWVVLTAGLFAGFVLNTSFGQVGEGMEMDAWDWVSIALGAGPLALFLIVPLLRKR
jgi:hypothetical protein